MQVYLPPILPMSSDRRDPDNADEYDDSLVRRSCLNIGKMDQSKDCDMIHDRHGC